MQIYWGAVPYVIIQIIMVALVIVFPQMVMVYKSDAPLVDPSKIEINIPGVEGVAPPSEGGAKGGDPLQNLLQQQQESEQKSNQSIEDAYKK